MPLKRGTTKENCISINYNEMKSKGNPHRVAQAASLSHCSKIWGDSKNELEKLTIELLMQDLDTKDMRNVLNKLKDSLRNIRNKVI